jgi:RES domain-containing protein
MPRVIVALEARLHQVLDLTDGETRQVLGVSKKRFLEEPWREKQQRGREALTQAIGRLAYGADLEGILVPSAARKGGTNLIIFPANLDPPRSWLRIVNKGELPSPG